MSEKTDGSHAVKATSILSDTEMQELRQLISRAKAAEDKEAQTQYYEKLSSLRSDARWTLKSLLDKCKPLKEYRDAQYVGQTWKYNPEVTRR